MLILLLPLVLLLTSACAADQPRPTVPHTPLTGACVRSFRPTLAAWEAQFGRVPPKCAYLDAQYRVNLVSESELAAAQCSCRCSDRGGQLVGCTTQPDMQIYLLGGRANIEMVDTSAHEWIHAIEQCVHGSMDVDHVRTQLWERNSGAGSVEIQAQAGAQIGDCL